MYNRGSKRSAKRTTTPTRKFRRHMVEALEQRQMLTTLYGGGAGRAVSYSYATAGSFAQITIFGNVTAEFIFADATGAVVNAPVTFNGTGTGVNGGSGGSINTGAGLDLFSIYVSQSDINSYISIEQTASTSDPIGSPTTITIDPANPKGTTRTASAGSGGLRLGALDGGTTGSPIIKTDINGAAIGVRPAGLDDLPEDSLNDLSAGLRVANGNDLGKFLFDGEVFGKVHVDGSINLFYAGWLLTGDARGAFEGFGTSGLPLSLADSNQPSDVALGESFGHVVPRQNFYVGGDLQNLASDGPLGWDGTFGDADPNLAPFYLSGVDIYVRGRIGQVHANEGNTATITALNMDPAVAGFKRPVVYQEELEAWEHFPGSGVNGDFFTNGGFPNSSGSGFSGGFIIGGRTGRDAVPFENDTFNSAQMLGTFSSPNGNDIIDVLGGLIPVNGPDNDPVDYYGVALMAGQTVHVVVGSLNGNAHVGIMDPDGRLVASDYNNLGTPVSGGAGTSTYTYQVAYQYTADRPGIYRFIVGEKGDVNFVGTPNTTNPEQYELIITGAGVMAIGGVTVSNQFTGAINTPAGAARMLDIAPGTHQIEADNGDFGGLYVFGQYNMTLSRLFVPTIAPPPGSISNSIVFGSLYVPAGNLRTLDVGTLGIGTTTGTSTSQTIGAGIDLNVPFGSVGLVQVRDAGGIAELNPSIQLDFNSAFQGGSSGSGSTSSLALSMNNRRARHGLAALPAAPTTPTAFAPASLSIGRDYQVINITTRFTGGIFARGGMGILRANSINGANQTNIYLDTDAVGFDGKSDLIDVATSIDGPALQHGPGGNFRYMRVGGGIGIDSQFGASNAGYVAHPYGESVSFTDDSGSSINITPIGLPVANTAYDPLDLSKGPQFLLPQLATMAYPVRSGGVIVMDVQSTGSVVVNSQAGSFNGTAEISRIEVHGSGLPPVRTTRFTGNNGYQTTLTTPFTSQAQGNDLSVTIGGSAITDVAYVVGMTPEIGNSFFTSPNTTIFDGNLIPPFRSTVSTFGNLTSVTNSTGGEVLSVNAANLGNLASTGTVGITRTTSIAGNSLNFIAPIAVGTAYAARTGAASDNAPVNPTGTVVGSAFPFNQQTFGIAIGGDVVSIRANLGLGNIIATGIIGSVVANADGRDVGSVIEGINAPIYAFGDTSAIPVGSASGVANASILSVNIGEGVGSAGTGDFARTGIFAGNSIGTIVGNNADIRGDIVYGQTLGSITLKNGSLIDANVLNLFTLVIAGARESAGVNTAIFFTNAGIARNIGSINITGNGGIIGTLIATTNIGPINVGGFGIISSQIVTAFSSSGIASITAGGYGIRDTIISAGDSLAVVNVTGNGKNLSTDQVEASVRQSEFVRADPQLNLGFDPYSGRALTPLNDIHAALGTSQATPVIAGITDTGVIENTQINAQRALGKITAQVIRGDFGATTGRPLTRISAGNSIDTIQTRGLINGLQVGTGRIKNFLPASDVLALFMTISGPLDNVTIKGTLGAGSVIEATGPNGRIGNVSIKKNLNGTIHAVQSIGTVTIGGSLTGSLKIDGTARTKLALNKLQVGGTIANGALDIGTSGAIVNVGTIIIGKNLGGSAADTMHITGTLDRLQVGGAINSTITVGRGIGTLQAQRINGPVRAGGIKNLLIKKGGLHGALSVGNKLDNATIAGGVFSNISANNGIGTITVTGGGVAAGTTIQSGFGAIGTIRVKGDLDGSVLASGKIGQIIAGGNLGSGTTPLEVAGSRLGLLQVGGSIRAGVSVHVRGPIDALIVGKNVDEGAIIEASALNRQKVGGQVFGTLLIG